MEEVWKPLKDYEEYYAVSNLGRVKSFRKNIIMKSSLNTYGYPSIEVTINKQPKLFCVHQLVLNTFKPNLTGKKLQCNHIDLNKQNNNINNLEWCSGSENVMHAKQLGQNSRIGEKNTYAKLTEHDILEIRSLYKKSVNNKTNANTLSQVYNVSPSHIRLIANKQSWKHI